MQVEVFKSQNQVSDAAISQKYRDAAAIANDAMNLAISLCVPDRKVSSISEQVDSFILERTSIYPLTCEKGIAFPTCLSLNNCIRFYSPASEESSLVLSPEDVVKIELGVHIDGYIATLAHTIVLNPNGSVPISGSRADAICAAHFAAEAVMKMLKPGQLMSNITGVIDKIAKAFKCNPVRGTCTSEMKRFVLDAKKVIQNHPEDIKSAIGDEGNFEDYVAENDVFAINILMTSGSDEPKESIKGQFHETSIYQRIVNQRYELRLKSSRSVYKTIDRQFSVFPFNVRALQQVSPDTSMATARVGLTECANHGLIRAHPVMQQGAGEFVAQFKFTVLVTGQGNERITSSQLPMPYVHSTHSLSFSEPELYNEIFVSNSAMEE